jgi:tetratricopeptide (TPR) repeat protein
MTMPNEPGLEKNFVHSRLPWIIAAAAAVVYLLTLNHWLSLTNLLNAARISGFSWNPELHGPLYYLVTFPVRWLPAKHVPLALNLFALLCAVLTLALLARSVALLPHDRTEQQRQRERSEFSLLTIPLAWIPPVLAALVCGLQLTFWERATAASNENALFSTFGSDEMFNLLLFAYCIRGLLEYRIGQRNSWLMRAAFAWGLAISNSSLMFCLLPIFIISLLWLKGLGFFNLGFLGRILLCAVPGLLLFLALPVIQELSADAHRSFWFMVAESVGLALGWFRFFLFAVPKIVLLLLAVSSFLPILVISIRWSSNFGDPSRTGSFLTRWMFHLAHAALLGACIWVAFDPLFSPRHKGFAYPILYYLGALSVGYLSGYFLLVFRPLNDRFRPPTAWQYRLHGFSLAGVCFLMILVPVGLVWRNLPQIRITNGPAMSQFAAWQTQHLPGRGVVLSDDAIRLFVAEAWLARVGEADKYLFLDTQLLPISAYHAFQQKRYPEGWPVVVNFKSFDKVPDVTLFNLMLRLAEKNPVYYLHPSFGYYFERYYAQPHGLSYELRNYPTNSLSRPPLQESEIVENEKFWNDAHPGLESLISEIQPRARAAKLPWEQNLLQQLQRRLRLPRETNNTAVVLGRYYSQALNSWGVDVQRACRLKEAQGHFQTALALNGSSITARANAAVNTELQAGRHLSVQTPKSVEDELGQYHSWEQAVRETGPSDNPTHCFGEGIVCAQGNLLRQSGQQFERVHQLVPDNLLVRLWLTRFYIANRVPEKALDLVDGFHVSDATLEAAGLRRLDVVQAEASVLYANGKSLEAEQLLQQSMRNDPNNDDLITVIAQISTRYGSFTNAISAVDRHLQLRPDDIGAWLSKGLLETRITNYTEAIAVFTHVLTMETNNYPAILDRAYASVKSERYAEALRDYESLRRLFPNSLEVNSGLAEIAFRKNDTNTALYFYGLCVSNSNPRKEQLDFFNARIKSLKGETIEPKDEAGSHVMIDTNATTPLPEVKKPEIP